MIKVKDIHFRYSKTPILEGVSLNLDQGSILAIVGPSGGGKSSLLRVISGLENLDRGSIEIDGMNVTSFKPEKREIGMLFQDYALFPHMTVGKNILYGMKKKDRKALKELLSLVDLEGYEKRFPHELSGGQQQRVALARTLASKPKILLLDEPFSNLDSELIAQVRRELFKLIKKLNITTILVTHNYEDTEYADQVLKIVEGKIV